MLQSQFNLDHRLAELRCVGTELRQEQAARESTRRPRTVGAGIRSLVGGAAASGRPAGVAAARRYPRKSSGRRDMKEPMELIEPPCKALVATAERAPA